MATAPKNPVETKQQETAGKPGPQPAKPGAKADSKIDRTAPAGSENSLGAESIRDGRPDTKDDVVEAIDEETPGPDTLPDLQGDR
ncbi:MAG TPA: hypothetical protein VHX11_02310 [Acidobacteriaceae bacterium]|jgi:hypothetical protein|nr:hypothetical protein [Acidobacteriaceae bacterium]